jgi:hypothetical protein
LIFSHFDFAKVNDARIAICHFHFGFHFLLPSSMP